MGGYGLLNYKDNAWEDKVYSVTRTLRGRIRFTQLQGQWVGGYGLLNYKDHA